MRGSTQHRGMFVFVFLEMVWLRETFTADDALERLLARVRPFMRGQVARYLEALSADLAGVEHLACVDALMGVAGRPVAE